MVRLLLRLYVGEGLVVREPTDAEVIPEVIYGTTIWTVQETLLRHIYSSFDRLVTAIHCAANDHNPNHDGPAPRSIPLAALTENGTSMPGGSIFAGYVERDFEQFGFATMEAAKEFIRDAQLAYVHSFHWAINCIRSSLEHGYLSVWNWGAPLGMSRTEFYHRCLKGFTYGGFRSLRDYMAHDVRGNDMDFSKCDLCSLNLVLIYGSECARLITPHVQRLLLTNREDSIHLSIWPLPEPTMHTFIQDPADELVRWHLEDFGLTVKELDTAVLVAMGRTPPAFGNVHALE
jgi:hypothetical protein